MFVLKLSGRRCVDRKQIHSHPSPYARLALRYAVYGVNIVADHGQIVARRVQNRISYVRERSAVDGSLRTRAVNSAVISALRKTKYQSAIYTYPTL